MFRVHKSSCLSSCQYFTSIFANHNVVFSFCWSLFLRLRFRVQLEQLPFPRVPELEAFQIERANIFVSEAGFKSTTSYPGVIPQVLHITLRVVLLLTKLGFRSPRKIYSARHKGLLIYSCQIHTT